MALMTEALLVRCIIEAALSQRGDVIALCGQRDAPVALALSAQGVSSKEGLAHRLQAAPGDALGCLT